MRFELDTVASPQHVLAALTDFTDHRVRIWPRTLDPKRYRVHEVGDTWAVATEATAGSPFWVTARYDWSEDGLVRWDVLESSYGGHGKGSVTITPRGAGSHLAVQWDSPGARPLQRPLLLALHRLPVGRMIARMWRQSLDDYAAG
jgi:hypothetical protein